MAAPMSAGSHRGTLVIALILILAGQACALDRGALAGGGGALPDGSRLDAGDGGAPFDAFVAMDTSEPASDAACPPGFVDLNRSAADGCECEIMPEVCNGLDDDCNPGTSDGAEDPLDGAPCDGADLDQCAEGVLICNAARLDCDEDPIGHTETCDATDEDCDGFVDERLGPEVCGGGDEDCDGFVDENSATDARIFFADDDGDLHGDSSRPMRGCSTPAGYAEVGGDCDDTDPSRSPSLTEVCGGSDEDCDLAVDESGCGPCSPRYRGSSIYQVCPGPLTYGAAASACAATSGYHLAWIGTDGESDFVATEANRSVGRHWIGARQRERDGPWYLEGSSATASYTRWASGQPDDGGFGGREDCVEVGAFGDALWNDFPCGETRAFVCERAAP